MRRRGIGERPCHLTKSQRAAGEDRMRTASGQVTESFVRRS